MKRSIKIMALVAPLLACGLSAGYLQFVNPGVLLKQILVLRQLPQRSKEWNFGRGLH